MELGIPSYDTVKQFVTTYADKGSTFAKENPYLSVGVGVLAVAGTALAYKVTRPAKQEDPLIARQNRIKEVMSRLLITEYHLPSSKDEKTEWSATNKAQPIFDDKTKKEIAIVATMIEKAVTLKAPLPNIILKGPPGVGKTMLGEALCHQKGIGFIKLPPGAMEKHLKTGNHIVALNEILQLAAECPVPVYLINDDGEGLVQERVSTKKADEKGGAPAAAAWLVEHEKLTDIMAQRRAALTNTCLEAFEKPYRKDGAIITTNRFPEVDKAFGSRCKVISIEAPDMEQRKHIIITHLPVVFENNKDMLPFFHKGRLEDMAGKTEGFTGRNIVKMLEDIYACVQLENGDMTQDIVDASIHAVRASAEKNETKKGPSVLDSVRQLARSIFSAAAAAA